MTKKKPAKKPEAEAPLPPERLPPRKPVVVPDPPVEKVLEVSSEVKVTEDLKAKVVGKPEPVYRRRSAVTGRFVSVWYAIRHPRITMRERREK